VDVPLLGIEKKESGLGFYLALFVQLSEAKFFSTSRHSAAKIVAKTWPRGGSAAALLFVSTTSCEPPNHHHHHHHHHILLLLEALLFFPF
jgi:hypothetical protein